MGKGMRRVYYDSEVILARQSLGHLARMIGVTPQGQRYIPAWFTTDLVCKALDLQIAHMQGKSWGIRRVWVKQPPQTGKSFHASELFPAGIVGRLPRARGVITGYGNEFLERTIPSIKTLVRSAAFAAAFPNVSIGATDGADARDKMSRADIIERRAGEWTKTGGFIVARGFGGAVNSISMDWGIVDDMYKGWKEATSAAENRNRRDFYTGVFTHRQQSRRTTMTLSTTPWTPGDLAHFIIDQWEKDREPYLVLSFPTFQREDTVKELERWNKSPALREGLARFLGLDQAALEIAVRQWGLRPYDQREYDYPLLPVGERDREFYEQTRRSAPARDLAALMQMDPEAEAVEAFPVRHWRFFDPTIKTKWQRIIHSCDPNGKNTQDGSFAVIGTWGLDRSVNDSDEPLEPTMVLKDKKPISPWIHDRLYETRARPGYSDLKDLILAQIDRWPEGRVLVLEDKAFGQSLATDDNFRASLRRRGIATIHKLKALQAKPTQINEGLVLVEPHETARDRWDRFETPHKSGYVRVPLKSHGRVTCEWLHDKSEGAKDEGDAQGFFTEFARAGQTPWDDRVDEASQLVDFASTQRPISGLSAFSGFAD